MPLGPFPFLSSILASFSSFLLSSPASVSRQQETEIKDHALRRLYHGLPLPPLLRLRSAPLEDLKKDSEKSEGEEEAVEEGEDALLGSWQSARVVSV